MIFPLSLCFEIKPKNLFNLKQNGSINGNGKIIKLRINYHSFANKSLPPIDKGIHFLINFSFYFDLSLELTVNFIKTVQSFIVHFTCFL